MDPFVVPTVAHPSQASEQLAKALFRSLPGQLQEQFHDRSISVWAWLVVIDRTLQTDGATSAALTQPMLCSQHYNQRALRRWLQSFFAITSFSARFSSSRSADICFKRREKNNIEFPTTTRDLRRSYETLFTDHNLFAEFYRLIIAPVGTVEGASWS
jgi:hypothetical protein